MFSPNHLPTLDTLQQVVAVNPAIIRGYAAGVAEELSRGPLTLDRRDRLIGRGKHLGLGRFEAALVLAVVERQQPAMKTAFAASFTDQAPTVQKAARPSRWPMLAAACAVQMTILAGAWWVITQVG